MLDWIVATKQVFQRFSHLSKVSWSDVGWEVRGGCCCVSSRLQEMTGTNQDIIGVYRAVIGLVTTTTTTTTTTSLCRSIKSLLVSACEDSNVMIADQFYILLEIPVTSTTRSLQLD